MTLLKFKYPQILQRTIANLMFPDSKAPTGLNKFLFNLGLIKKPMKNFFKYKGYADFLEFYNDQKNELLSIGKDAGQKSKYHQYFQDCEPATKPAKNKIKVKLASGKWCQIDSVSIAPSKEYIQNQETKGKKFPGNGKDIICFWGTNSFYEAQGLVDMSLEAKATGATMHTFNYPGMNNSTGKVREFNDLVNTGIAVVFDLLKQGKNPDDIILQGNCFGAAVAEQVRLHYKKEYGINLRIINSNTFKSLKSVVKEHAAKTSARIFIFPIKLILKIIAVTTGWNVKHASAVLKDIQSNDYLPTDMIHIQRAKDKTVLSKSYFINSKKLKQIFKYHGKDKNSFDTYITEEELEQHKIKNKDPHLAGLHLCKYKDPETGVESDVFTGIINPFLVKINKLKKSQPQTFVYDPIKHGETPIFKKTAVPRFIRQILVIATTAASLAIILNPITLPYITNLLALASITLPVSSVFISIETTISILLASTTAALVGLVIVAHTLEWLLYPLFKNVADRLNPNKNQDILDSSSNKSDTASVIEESEMEPDDQPAPQSSSVQKPILTSVILKQKTQVNQAELLNNWFSKIEPPEQEDFGPELSTSSKPL